MIQMNLFTNQEQIHCNRFTSNSDCFHWGSLLFVSNSISVLYEDLWTLLGWLLGFIMLNNVSLAYPVFY